MEIWIILQTCVVILLISHKTTGQGLLKYYDFDSNQQFIIVNEHNKLRSLEYAQDMQEMVWDPNLAYMARQWASQCVAEHSQRHMRRNKYGFDRVGENIWWSDEASLRTDLASVVRSFYNEKSYYDLSSGSCQSGQKCGHYTQVVWAESCAVGCGAAYCSNIAGGFSTVRPGHIIVCNYGPAGNYRGAAPYRYGHQCDACPLTCTSGKLCPSSCTGRRVADLPLPVQSQEPAPPAATTMAPASQVPISGSANPKCIDKNRLCTFWANRNLCAEAYMTQNCYGSCNRRECGKISMDVNDCKDQHEKCVAWASSGECSANAYFMNWKCPVSCRQCQHG